MHSSSISRSVGLFLLCAAFSERAQSDDRATSGAALDLEQLLETEIEVATGFPVPLSMAPAVASVITAAEIEEMGATSLDEILETVPGLHVGLAKGRGLDPVYMIRGIHSSLSNQVLLLINGVPITQLQNGGPALGFDLPVTSIARVEVIRGPGSAVYGADAFAGVVNVITKTAAVADGTSLGISAGSFSSRRAWVTHGGHHGGWDVFFSLDGSESDGDDGRILDRDLQTAIDAAFGTDASLAPGPLSTAFERVDLHLGLSKGPWTWRLWGWEKERGLGFGVAPVLDPAGRQQSTQVLADAIYRRDDLAEGWTFEQRISSFFLDQDSEFKIFPPGAIVGVAADGNVTLNPGETVRMIRFIDGVIGEPGAREKHHSFDSVAIYDALERHRWRLNAGLVLQTLRSREKKNFGPGVLDVTRSVVDGTLTDVTDTEYVYLENGERDHWYLSLQNEWSITDAWFLTAGLRYDHYSDFGGTINPRIALVHRARRDISLKLLYGSAFRAPSFGQLFTINNPARLGNPDLEPEEIDTFELVADYRPTRSLRATANVFTYAIDGLIDLVPDTPPASTSTEQNIGDQQGYGFEIEVEWEPRDAFRLESNFAWQHSEDENTGARVAEAPGWQFYLGLTLRDRHGWKALGRFHHVADRKRAVSDPRPPLADYSLVDLVLSRERILGRLDITLTLRNALDEVGREASDPPITFDFPLPGRAVFAEFRFDLR